MRELFVEACRAYNAVVFDGPSCTAARGDALVPVDGATVPDLVYLDPPYAPPRDDNCYIKRYHFLEGPFDVLGGS